MKRNATFVKFSNGVIFEMEHPAGGMTERYARRLAIQILREIKYECDSPVIETWTGESYPSFLNQPAAPIEVY